MGVLMSKGDSYTSQVPWQVVGVRTEGLKMLKPTASGVRSCLRADLGCFSGCLVALSTQGKEPINLDGQVKSFPFLVPFEIPDAGPT